MKEHLTIAYITSRLDCRIGWFLESLARETRGDLAGIRVVIVDFHAYSEMRQPFMADNWSRSMWKASRSSYFHTAPKPTVWQGPSRLTTEDYFAAANTRNTALCLAPDGWIAFVDDLSVLMPGWLSCVEAAMSRNEIVLGAYKKVKHLRIIDGIARYEDFPPGVDSRWGSGRDKPVPCAGSWLFGCSLAGPVEAFLSVNGWDEDADCCGMGGEDYICGMMMQAAGYRFSYDRRMLTLESEELHHIERPLKRVIEKIPGKQDASVVLLNMVKGGRKIAPNYFQAGGLRAERQRVLANNGFSPASIPEHSWYSGKPLQEL